MTPVTPGEFRAGDRVAVKNLPTFRARVVEERGPLGPNGEPVYLVRLRKKPEPMYIEVLGKQLRRRRPKRPATPLAPPTPG